MLQLVGAPLASDCSCEHTQLRRKYSAIMSRSLACVHRAVVAETDEVGAIASTKPQQTSLGMPRLLFAKRPSHVHVKSALLCLTHADMFTKTAMYGPREISHPRRF